MGTKDLRSVTLKETSMIDTYRLVQAFPVAKTMCIAP